MEIDDAELATLRTALDVLESASTVPKRSRTTNIFPFIEEIGDHGYQYGIRSAELERLVKVLAVKNELDQTSVTNILRNLYPAERVSSNVLLKAINSLGQGQNKPSAATQAGIVKWISAVHEFLVEPELLLQLYNVFFNILDITSLRASLCQLLALITRRRHVRPFRIQRLLELCQQFGGDASLVELLKVYKNFCPDIIVGGNVSGGRSSILKLDVEWRSHLVSIQEAASQVDGSLRRDGFGGFKVARSGLLKKRNIIPEVHTFRAEELAVTLEEITSVQSFVENLSKIEPPSQIVSALKDPLLQKFMMLKVSPDTDERLDFWLQRYFEDEIDTIEQGFGLSPALTDVLRAVSDYTNATKELHPTAEKFLMVYLPMWNGVSDLGPILDLLAFLPLGDFSQLYPVLLAPLEQSVLSSAQSPFETLFEFYGQLVPRWLTAYSSRPADRTLLAYYTSLTSLLDHIATLALSAVVSAPSAGVSVARYYATVSTLTRSLIGLGMTSNPIPIALPPPHLFYLILFSPSLTALSVSLSALSSFKTVVERVIKIPLPSSLSTTFTTAVSNSNSSVLSSLNAYLLDAANLLWRSRALAPDPPANTACMIPDATRKALMAHLPDLHRHYSVPLLFGLTGHVLFSGAAFAAWRQFEDELIEKDQDRMMVDGESQRRHKGPVSQRSLAALVTDGGVNADWREVRERIVKYLDQNGVDGIERFRKAAMGNKG